MPTGCGRRAPTSPLQRRRSEPPGGTHWHGRAHCRALRSRPPPRSPAGRGSGAAHDRALIQLRSFPVRELISRSLGRLLRVVQRLLVFAGKEEVQRQEAAGLRRIERRLEPIGDARVQLAPRPERQARIGRVTHDSPSEPEIVTFLLDEEFTSRSHVSPSGGGSPSSSTSARNRRWNVTPSTEARRTSARSAGARASIRAIAAVSMDSGSIAPEVMTCARSSANCGFPPARSTTRVTSCGNNGASTVAASTSSTTSSWPRGSSRIVVRSRLTTPAQRRFPDGSSRSSRGIRRSRRRGARTGRVTHRPSCVRPRHGSTSARPSSRRGTR